MAKRVYFCFHYQDVVDFRANVVRNHKLTKGKSAGYFDASIWETAKKTSELSLKRLINGELQSTSVTCVLVGTHTFERRWVDYEIMKSLSRGNGILAIHINGIEGKDGKTKEYGQNPFYYLGFSFDKSGKKTKLHNFIRGKWVDYEDLGGWDVESVPENERNIIYRLSTIYPIYDWVADNGFENFESWIG